MTRHGVRKPRPIGPAMPPALDGSVPVRYSPAVPAGRRDRRHVVEEAAVLVVVHDEDGLCPDVGVGDQDVQDLLDEVLAPLRRRGRMLALRERRDDPGDAGERAIADVGLEVALVRRCQSPSDQLEAGEREDVGVILEVRQDAEAKQAGRVVVDLPAHPGLEQRFWHRLPVQRARHRHPVGRGGDHRAAGFACRVDVGGDRHEPVRVRGPEHRAEVVVADRERVGERVVEGEFGAGEVTHRHRPVGGAVRGQVDVDEGVHLAAVPAVVLGHPVVGDVVGGFAVLRWRIVEQVERLGVAARVDAGSRLVAELVEHRVGDAADGLGGHGRVGESAHARQGAEVVVEGAVLLHEDHDVLDVAQAGGARGGRGHLVEQPGLRVGDRVVLPGPGGRGADGRGGAADHEGAPGRLVFRFVRFRFRLVLLAHWPILFARSVGSVS